MLRVGTIMEVFVLKFVILIVGLASVTAEPPVGDSVSIVSDLETNPTGGVYGGSQGYSSQYQTNGHNSYTTAVSSNPHSGNGNGGYRNGYSSRPTYGTAYLPVIPVTASYYSFTPTSTGSDYGAYNARPSTAYGVSQPWTSSHPWAGSPQPWASSTQPWQGSAQPWSSTNPWNSGPWASTQPWASQPWASSSQPWSSTSNSWSGTTPWAYGNTASSYNNYDSQNVLGIKPPSL